MGRLIQILGRLARGMAGVEVREEGGVEGGVGGGDNGEGSGVATPVLETGMGMEGKMVGGGAGGGKKKKGKGGKK